MLLQGIQPPEVGSPKDRILSLMFSMDRAREADILMGLGALLTIVGQVPKEARKIVEDILTKTSESTTYSRWSIAKRKEETRRRLTDEELLARVANLGEMKRG